MVVWFVYDFYFKPKGLKVQIQWIRVIGTRAIYYNPQKKYIGINKEIEGVEEFILPKSMGGGSLEGLNHDELFQTNTSMPLVKLLQIGHKTFIPIKTKTTIIKQLKDLEKKGVKVKTEFQDDINQQRTKPEEEYLAYHSNFIVDKDVNRWAQTKRQQIEARHKINDKWAEWRPYIAFGIVLMISAFTFIATVNYSKQNWDDSIQGRLDATAEERNLANTILDRAKGISTQNNVQTAPTNAPTPTGT